MTMALVASRIKNASFNRDTDLPLPNLYWCSVDHPVHGKFHTHLAADHTIAAVQKMANWCAEYKGFRPFRSDSQIKVRRLKLGDLIENPEAHRIALQSATLAGERDIIAALTALPQWIADHIASLAAAPRVIPQPPPQRELRPSVDFEAAWATLQHEISSMSSPA